MPPRIRPPVSDDLENINITITDSEPGLTDLSIPASAVEPPRTTVQMKIPGRLGSGPSLDSVDSVTRKQSTTADIAYFFTPKTDGQSRFCIPCRSNYDKLVDKSQWPKNQNYTYSSTTASSGLRSHLERFHVTEYLKIGKERGWVMQLASIKAAQAQEVQASAAKRQLITFSADNVTNYLIRFIAANDQSINVVENQQFRDLLTLFRDDYNDDDMPHRTRIRQGIIETWQGWFTELKKLLKSAVGALSFTTDIWSNKRRQSYLCITVHWVAYNKPNNQGLILKSSLLAFHPLHGKHSGKAIAEVIYSLLQRADVTGEHGHWTLDNASNNGAFLKSLKEIYGRCRPEVTFDPQDSRISCFPHIVNICAQHTIKALNGDIDDKKKKKKDSNSDSESDESDDESDAIQPIPADLLGKVRSLIRAIRASGQRQEEFNRVVVSGNNADWWKDADNRPEQIKPLKFLLDVKTRWDSTYQMLIRLRMFKQPLDQFLGLGSSKDIKKFKLSTAEWNRITEMIAVLKHPHDVQQVMSKEKMPVLAGTIPTFERFMTAWETLSKKNPHLTVAIDKGLSFANKYYKRMDDTIAYIVAMFIHPGIRLSWIKKYWGATYLVNAEKKIKETMSKFRARLGICIPNPTQAGIPAQSTKTSLGYANLGLPSHLTVDEENDDMSWPEISFEGQSVDQEFESYMSTKRTAIDQDLLSYWELHREQYPTIFAIAMDYIPIQASSVPCERAFSSSAETDTSRRNRISPLLMEALQMLKYAFRDQPMDFTGDLLTHEAELTVESNHDLLAELISAVKEDSDVVRENAMDRIVVEIEQGQEPGP